MIFECIKYYAEPISDIATIVGAGALVWAYLSWRDGRQGLHHNVITSCSSRFQELVDDLADPNMDLKKARQYLDLCNEELFYFENDYLPRPVVVEWLDGMLSHLPLRVRKSSFSSDPGPVNAKLAEAPALFFNNEDFWNLMSSYPRLNHVFSVSSEAAARIRKTPNGDDYRQREEMLKALLSNVKSYLNQSAYRNLVSQRWNIFKR